VVADDITADGSLAAGPAAAPDGVAHRRQRPIHVGAGRAYPHVCHHARQAHRQPNWPLPTMAWSSTS